MGTRPAILVDTNIIIELARVGGWKRLRAHERLVTVRQCCNEALSGIPGTPGRVPIAPDDLEAPLEVINVSLDQRVQASLTYPDLVTIDAGERDLLIHAMSLHNGSATGGSMGSALKKAGLAVKSDADAFHIVSADSAAVRVAILMGLGERVVSLEDILEHAGIRVAGLKGHYARATLAAWKTKHLLRVA